MTVAEGTVSFTNGSIKFSNKYHSTGTYSDIYVGEDKSAENSDEVVSKGTVKFDNVNFEGSVMLRYGSSVEVSNSEIHCELYGICTNASTSKSSTEPVNVTIKNTKLYGETPVMLNVPANLTMDGCTVVGGWQGVMMRGGTANISNCDISLQEQYATPVEGTGWAKDRNSGKVQWGSGNEIAIAGITMGNNTTTAYQYPTKVTLKNTKVSGYEGYWAVYADATSVCTVDFTYDNDCTFSPALDADKSFKQGKNAGNNYITVTDGNGTTTTY